MSDKLYLNLGSGGIEVEGCVSIDVNADTKPQVVADIRELPYGDETVDGIIASHILEHIPREDLHKCLHEWKRVLKIGGTLYMEVPDFEKACKYYLENYLGLRDFWYQCIYGACRWKGDEHRQGFTQFTLTEALFAHGFGNLRWKIYCDTDGVKEGETIKGEKYWVLCNLNVTATKMPPAEGV
jgi:SAM-dependent methyltransferase